MTDISVRTTSYQVEKRDWLLGPHGTGPGDNPSIVLDVSAFTQAIHYPNGYIPSGCPVVELESGLYGPYSVTDEVQTLTVGGAGLTSFTITYAGQTTGPIDDQATAADVKAALVALSNIGANDVTVAGNAGGPWTVTFGGALADTNVAQMTTTPTGGTGTVTVATATGGGTEGAGVAGVCKGLTFDSVTVTRDGSTLSRIGNALFVHGFVRLSRLPFTLDANGQNDLKLVHFSA
jgi:hypothetical protein